MNDVQVRKTMAALPPGRRRSVEALLLDLLRLGGMRISCKDGKKRMRALIFAIDNNLATSNPTTSLTAVGHAVALGLTRPAPVTTTPPEEPEPVMSAADVLARQSRFMARFLTVADERFDEVVATLFQLAKDGNVQALELILQYKLGIPSVSTQEVAPDEE